MRLRPAYATAFVLTIVLAVAAGIAPIAGAADPPRLSVGAPPDVLRPGDTALVVAEVEGVAVCRLDLTPSGASAVRSSLVTASGANAISWTWRVPATTGSGTWSGDVGCWKDRKAEGVAPYKEALGGSVNGVAGRALDLVEDDAVAVSSKFADPRSGVEKGADWAQIVTAALGIPGLAFIGLTLVMTRRQMRAERTAQVLERYNTREFLDAWSAVQRFLYAPHEKACVERIRRAESASSSRASLLDEDRALNQPTEAMVATARVVRPAADTVTGASQAGLMSAANFYEETGALFNRREIDDTLVIRSFGQATAQALEAVWWWIGYQRDGRSVPVAPRLARRHETETYAEWERMVRKVLRKRPELRSRRMNRPGRNDVVRAICIPYERGRDASEGEWERCGDLSDAVGTVLRQPDGLERLSAALTQRLGDDAGPPNPSEWPKRTMLLPWWRDEIRAPRWPIAVTSRLGARLHGADHGNEDLEDHNLRLLQSAGSGLCGCAAPARRSRESTHASHFTSAIRRRHCSSIAGGRGSPRTSSRRSSRISLERPMRADHRAQIAPGS